MQAGYSGKKLTEKLGIKEGSSAIFFNPPENYLREISELPFPLLVKNKLSGKIDFIHFFTSSKADLEKKFPKLVEHLQEKGMIWISWPKRSSGVPTDITENTLREIGLPLGVVDIKVIAVDEIWSGLKFSFRRNKM